MVVISEGMKHWQEFKTLRALWKYKKTVLGKDPVTCVATNALMLGERPSVPFEMLQFLQAFSMSVQKKASSVFWKFSFSCYWCALPYCLMGIVAIVKSCWITPKTNTSSSWNFDSFLLLSKHLPFQWFLQLSILSFFSSITLNAYHSSHKVMENSPSQGQQKMSRPPVRYSETVPWPRFAH